MESITDIFQSADSQDQQSQRFFGKYRGLVTDNQDPNSLGRIRARVPEILGSVETGWALPALPYSGNGSGVYTVPEPGAGVWIEFESGDVSRPIWTGCWWGTGQLPTDETGSPTTPSRRIVRSEQGLLLSLDDDAQTITLSDSNGTNLIKFEVQQGQIKIMAATKVVVEAPQIELVQNATHPLVFGDNLLTYLNQLVSLFNAHVHPGQLAAGVIPVTPSPPVAPFVPATPSLLSMKVKTG
jgi:uncharacterized protein involved in type VI secretion and phage assembly